MVTAIRKPEKPATIRYLDHHVFKWIQNILTDDASPEDIVAFYVDNLIFRNGDYFKDITARYHLPNDILKAHVKICGLANKDYEGETK